MVNTTGQIMVSFTEMEKNWGETILGGKIKSSVHMLSLRCLLTNQVGTAQVGSLRFGAKVSSEDRDEI